VTGELTPHAAASIARQHTETAIAALGEICRNGENEGARIAAANALLDRGWGKPAFSVLARDPPEVITLNSGSSGSPLLPQNKIGGPIPIALFSPRPLLRPTCWLRQAATFRNGTNNP
jgi:hypothetical protein